MIKAKKRQRWLCQCASKKNKFLVEVLTAHLDGSVNLKILQMFKGNLVKVGDILKNERFTENLDVYLEGQDAVK